MRHYALLFGMLFTSGSTYVMQLAVRSGGFERLRGERASATEAAAPAPMELWYGGELAPLTIEARRGASPSAIAWIRLLEGSKREACSVSALLAKTPDASRRRPTVGVAL